MKKQTQVVRWPGTTKNHGCPECGRPGRRMVCHGQDLVFCVAKTQTRSMVNPDPCKLYDVPFTPQSWVVTGKPL